MGGADSVTFLQIFDSITENIVEKCQNFVVNNFMPIGIIFLSILLIYICLMVADNGLVIFILFLVIFVFNLNLIHNFTITNWFSSKSFYKILLRLINWNQSRMWTESCWNKYKEINVRRCVGRVDSSMKVLECQLLHQMLSLWFT